MIKLKSLINEGIEERIMYHGTDTIFERFDSNFIGTRTDPGFFGRGVYLLDDKDNARRWGKYTMTVEVKLENPMYITGITDFVNKSGYISPHARSKKKLSKKQFNELYKNEINRATTNLINKGHDGTVYTNENGVTQFTCFNPETQCKIINIENS